MSVQLTPSSSRRVDIDPAELFIDTAIQVRAGEIYHLQADGQWKDWYSVVDANGWTLPGIGWLRRYNRVPGVNWFALIACVGHELRTARVIGKSEVITVTPNDLRSADVQTLTVFANDWPCMYWNNKRATAEEGGPMWLTITRLG